MNDKTEMTEYNKKRFEEEMYYYDLYKKGEMTPQEICEETKGDVGYWFEDENKNNNNHIVSKNDKYKIEQFKMNFENFRYGFNTYLKSFKPFKRKYHIKLIIKNIKDRRIGFKEDELAYVEVPEIRNIRKRTYVYNDEMFVNEILPFLENELKKIEIFESYENENNELEANEKANSEISVQNNIPNLEKKVYPINHSDWGIEYEDKFEWLINRNKLGAVLKNIYKNKVNREIVNITKKNKIQCIKIDKRIKTIYITENQLKQYDEKFSKNNKFEIIEEILKNYIERVEKK